MRKSRRAGSKQYGVYRRRANGGTLVLCVVIVMLLAALITGATLFLTNLGATAYYTQRMDFVVNQLANYASSGLSWNMSNAPGIPAQKVADQMFQPQTGIADQLLSVNGLPPAHDGLLTVNGTIASVSLGCSGLTAVGNGLWLPNEFNVNAKSGRDMADDEPRALIACNIGSTVIYVPAYGMNGTFKLENFNIPYSQISITGLGTFTATRK